MFIKRAKCWPESFGFEEERIGTLLALRSLQPNRILIPRRTNCKSFFFFTCARIPNIVDAKYALGLEGIRVYYAVAYALR